MLRLGYSLGVSKGPLVIEGLVYWVVALGLVLAVGGTWQVRSRERSLSDGGMR